MCLRKSIIVFCLFAVVSLGDPPINEPSQAKYTIHGYLNFALRSPIQKLTAKLYPPKEKGGPVLITYPDVTNNFNFSDLPAGSYLLEISSGDEALYQRLLKLESDVLLAVPLGNLTRVSEFTLKEGASQPLPAFQNVITVKVGNIDRDLRPYKKPLSLTIIIRTKKSRPVRLTPPKLVMDFEYNGQKYILAGAVRTTPTKDSFIDCEIYRSLTAGEN